MKMNELIHRTDEQNGTMKQYAEEFEKIRQLAHSTDAPIYRKSFNWFRYIEYGKAIKYSNLKLRDTILDAGGAGSLMTVYLAKMGVKVTSMDRDFNIVDKIVDIEKKMNIDITHVVGDIVSDKDTDVWKNSFNKIMCISVIEHIPNLTDRLNAMKNFGKMLKIDGILAISFDYQNPKVELSVNSFDEIADMAVASGLVPFESFYMDNYIPRKDCAGIGTLFLKKIVE